MSFLQLNCFQHVFRIAVSLPKFAMAFSFEQVSLNTVIIFICTLWLHGFFRTVIFVLYSNRAEKLIGEKQQCINEGWTPVICVLLDKQAQQPILSLLLSSAWRSLATRRARRTVVTITHRSTVWSHVHTASSQKHNNRSDVDFKNCKINLVIVFSLLPHTGLRCMDNIKYIIST